MNKLILLEDGSLLRKSQNLEGDPLMFLGFEVELAAACTLRSFFRVFERYDILTRLNAFFPSYMEQYQSAPRSDCLYDGFECLEFNKTVEMIGFPGKPRLEIYNSLHGVSGAERLELRSVSLENLLDMPLKLGQLRHIIFGDQVDVFEFSTVFNLFEFIDGILWELSFQGALMACELRR